MKKYASNNCGQNYKKRSIYVNFKGHPRDIDECSLIDDCCINGKCINTDGSYMCECPNGYHLDSDGHTCVDKDECSSLVNPCGQGTCSNSEGGYDCECNDGLYQGDDGKCVCKINIRI